MKSRKELKKEYKHKKSPMGVFQIKNTTNGKIFIGSSMDLVAIWNRQKAQLKFGGHPNKELQADWNTFGEANFTYEILAEIEDAQDMESENRREVKMLEEIYIEELQPFGEKGYNKK